MSMQVEYYLKMSNCARLLEYEPDALNQWDIIDHYLDSVQGIIENHTTKEDIEECVYHLRSGMENIIEVSYYQGLSDIVEEVEDIVGGLKILEDLLEDYISVSEFLQEAPSYISDDFKEVLKML